MLVDEARLTQIERAAIVEVEPGPTEVIIADLCETLRAAWQQRDDAQRQMNEAVRLLAVERDAAREEVHAMKAERDRWKEEAEVYAGRLEAECAVHYKREAERDAIRAQVQQLREVLAPYADCENWTVSPIYAPEWEGPDVEAPWLSARRALAAGRDEKETTP